MKGGGIRWVCLGASLAALSCAKAPFTSPLDGGAPWRELESEHFIVETDASTGRAHDLVAELEQSFALLQQAAFAYRPPLTLKVRVVNLNGLNNLEALGQPNADGFSKSAQDGFQSRQVIVLADGKRRLDSELLLHELTHRFIAFYLPSAPLWLNEGLAQYYSTLQLEAGHAVAGAYLGDRTFTALNWEVLPVHGQTYLRIPVTAVPSAAALLRMSPQEFYSNSQATDDQLALAARYTGAWALVHTLTYEPNGYHRLQHYLVDLVNADVPEPQAWQAHFGDLKPAQLQNDFERFMRGHDTDLVPLPVELRAPAPPRERAMSASEVHVLWAELRGPRDRKTDRDLQRAVEADPRNPEAYLQRAFQAQAEHADWSIIEHNVNHAYQLAPDSPRYLLAKAKLELEVARREKRSASSTKIWASKLARRASGAPELAFLAYEALDRQRVAVAQHYALKAMAADPSASYCYVLTARVAAARLDYRRAVTALSTGLNLLADGKPTFELQHELESYQALARDAANAPTARAPADDSSWSP